MAFGLTQGAKRTNRYRRTRRTAGVRRRGQHLNSRVVLGVVLTALLGINAYVFFFRGGTSIQDLLEAGALHQAAMRGGALRAGAAVLDAPLGKRGFNHQALSIPQNGQLVKGTMKGHIGLASALEAAGLQPADAVALIEALRNKLDMRTLQPTQRFEAVISPRTRKLFKFTYFLSALQRVAVTRQADGSFRAARQETPLEIRVARMGGRIESSLSAAVVRAGGTGHLASQLMRLFSWDVNWVTDPRPGDQFRLIVQRKYKEGRFWGFGRVLAAEYRTADQSHVAVYFTKDDGSRAYFNADGRSTRRAFVKTPLNFRRVSSQFNPKRMHPVLHRTKGHFGVDYAAPTGTPVWAASDGVAVKIGRFGGAGQMVTVRHANGIKTVYMHLSRFARGLRNGHSVKQRQVIGYVGATGLATGPHLHYGIYVRGRPIDPQRFNVGRGAMLPPRDRARFLSELPVHLAALDQVPMRGGHTRLAQRPLGQQDSPDWLP